MEWEIKEPRKGISVARFILTPLFFLVMSSALTTGRAYPPNPRLRLLLLLVPRQQSEDKFRVVLTS